MKKYSFKAGDIVPQWVEKTRGVKLIFEVDAIAYQRKDHVELYPIKTMQGGSAMMVASSDDPRPGQLISGAPTRVFGSPLPLYKRWFRRLRG